MNLNFVDFGGKFCSALILAFAYGELDTSILIKSENTNNFKISSGKMLIWKQTFICAPSGFLNSHHKNHFV